MEDKSMFDFVSQVATIQKMLNDNAVDSMHYISIFSELRRLAFKDVSKIKPVRWYYYLYLRLFQRQRVEATIGELKYIAWYREIRGNIYITKHCFTNIKEVSVDDEKYDQFADSE